MISGFSCNSLLNLDLPRSSKLAGGHSDGQIDDLEDMVSGDVGVQDAVESLWVMVAVALAGYIGCGVTGMQSGAVGDGLREAKRFWWSSAGCVGWSD